MIEPGPGRRGPFPPLLLILATVGCGDGRARQDCRLERETSLATTPEAPDAVGLARGGPGAWLAVWSAGGATHLAWLDDGPAVVDGPRRVLRGGFEAPLGEAGGSSKTFWQDDDGGRSLAAEAIAAIPADDGRVLVALVEAPGPDLSGGVHALLVPPPPIREEPRAVLLGPAGPSSDSISVALLSRTAMAAWHAVTPAGPRVRLATLDIDSMEPRDSTELAGSLARFHPSLATDGESALLAWAEEPRSGAAPGLAIRAAPLAADLGLGEQRQAARTGFHDAALHLVAIPGGFGLAYRDDADGDDTLEYHFVALDRTGAPAGPPARISRADGPRGPRLAPAGGLIFGAAIRSFQRNLLVGVNRFDAAGAKAGGELQVYADKSHFTRVAIAADGDGAMIVYGEDRPLRGRILASRVQCRAP
jgi:hypothetical protein